MKDEKVEEEEGFITVGVVVSWLRGKLAETEVLFWVLAPFFSPRLQRHRIHFHLMSET
jgi:hypothetical protein